MTLLVLILLIVAVALFILSVTSLARGWMLGIGLACFAGAFLAPMLFARL